MKLRRTSKANLGNKPHQGMGQWGRGKRKPDLKAGAHLRQRDHSGFDDSKGYRGTPAVSLEPTPGYGRAGSDSGRNIGYPGTLAQRRALDSNRSDSFRRDGYHTGKPSRQDSRRRDGPEGNSKGSPPPGIGKGKAVRGTPDSHLGTAGRGDKGRLGKHDNYKGKPTTLNEDPSHEWFEKLGSG